MLEWGCMWKIKNLSFYAGDVQTSIDYSRIKQKVPKYKDLPESSNEISEIQIKRAHTFSMGSSNDFKCTCTVNRTQ